MQTPSLVAFVPFSFDDISLFVSFDNRKQRIKGNAERGKWRRDIETERTGIEVKDALKDAIEGKVTESDVLFTQNRFCVPHT